MLLALEASWIRFISENRHRLCVILLFMIDIIKDPSQAVFWRVSVLHKHKAGKWKMCGRFMENVKNVGKV